MKCKAGLKGRRTKKDQRSMAYQCDKLHLDASVNGDSYILAAIYHSLFSEDTTLTKALLLAAKKLNRAEHKQSRTAGEGEE